MTRDATEGKERRTGRRQDTLLSAGLRNGSHDSTAVRFRGARGTSRRFALARLQGDHLAKEDACEQPLPSATAELAREDFPRAFARNPLCPLPGFRESLDIGESDDEDIESAAEHFDVSPLSVQATLGKFRVMNRNRLDA